MVEPESKRELALALSEFRTSVEARLGELNKKVWYLFGVLGALVAGAIALYAQLGDVKTEVAVLRGASWSRQHNGRCKPN